MLRLNEVEGAVDVGGKQAVGTRGFAGKNCVRSRFGAVFGGRYGFFYFIKVVFGSGVIGAVNVGYAGEGFAVGGFESLQNVARGIVQGRGRLAAAGVLAESGAVAIKNVASSAAIYFA